MYLTVPVGMISTTGPEPLLSAVSLKFESRGVSECRHGECAAPEIGRERSEFGLPIHSPFFTNVLWKLKYGETMMNLLSLLVVVLLILDSVCGLLLHHNPLRRQSVFRSVRRRPEDALLWFMSLTLLLADFLIIGVLAAERSAGHHSNRISGRLSSCLTIALVVGH